MFSKTSRVVLLSLLLISQVAVAGDILPTTFKTRHYVIHTDLPPVKAKAWAKHMDTVANEYTRRFAKAGLRSRVQGAQNLYLFATQESYIQGMAKMGVNGNNSGGMFFYNMRYHGLAVWIGPQNPTRIHHVLQHEGFHQFAHRYLGRIPIWVNEGLAEYFGNGLLINRKFITGQVDLRHLSMVKAAVKQKQTFSFKEMINMTGAEWGNRLKSGDPRASLQYGQAWAMAHFLIHGQRGKYSRAFMNYLVLLSQGRNSNTAFQQAFGSADYTRFENKWLENLDKLKPDPVSTAIQRLTFLGEGLKWLHEKKIEVDSLEAMEKELASRQFRVVLGSHGMGMTRATDSDNFKAPQPQNAKRKSSIEWLTNKDEKLPAEIAIKGLKFPLKLTWEQDENGQLKNDIVFK